MNIASRWTLLSVMIPLGLLGACSTDSDSPREECVTLELTEQQVRRVAVGSTHYLPQLDDACGAHQWTVRSGPEGNQNLIVSSDDEHPRFTPVVPGDYVFEVSALGLTRSLSTVAADSVPFEHYNYYPGHSLTRVGDELWVAAVYSPEIIRFNPDSMEELGRISVGPWPVAIAWKDGMTHAVVAQKAGDTLGIVDVASKRLVDAVWVGDEPSNVVLDESGSVAFVALSTEAGVAVVDTDTWTLQEKVETNFDPLAMVFDPTGQRLFVASHRSGDEDRTPLEPDPRTSIFDVAVVDASDLRTTRWIESVGSTIGGMTINDGVLYVATTRTMPKDLGRVVETPFMHQVVAYSLESLEELRRVDLTDQPSSAGPAVSPRGLTALNNRLWVVAEGSDQAVALDISSVDAETFLSELTRVDVVGRPRAITRHGDSVYAHGAQRYTVTRIGEEAVANATVEFMGDRRTAEVRRGQSFFTGAGDGFGTDHSCNNCHLDALMDGNLWPAGPFTGFFETRPYFWVEGTTPLGWDGYHENARMFAYTVINPTVGAAPNTQLAEDLTRYISGIMPPPVANGYTERDGQMTDAALRGRAIFDGKARCATCHTGSLRTNQQVLPAGSTVDSTVDTPSLVSIYRHGYWLADGSARSLDEAVDAMLRWTEVTDLSAEERADLVRYLEELTTREFFLLASEPAAGALHAGADQPLVMTFSHSLFDDEANRGRVRLTDANGEAISSEVAIEGRYVTLIPDEVLRTEQTYRVVFEPEFESFDTRNLGQAVEVEFTVAAEPSLRFEGEYVWTVNHPGLDFANRELRPDTPIESNKTLVATPTASGANIVLTLNDETSVAAHVVIAGDQIRLPALPVAIGNGADLRMSAGWSTVGTLVDEDGDGIADTAEGEMRIAGPSYSASGMGWSLQRDDPNAVDLETCDAHVGPHELSAAMDGDTLIIEWPGDLEAIAVYVSSPSAEPPLGPGPMTGGDAYWIVQSAVFPTGFGGPVTYGQVPMGAQDVTTGSGGPEGGAELPTGECIKVTAVFTDFATSKRYLKF